MFVSHCTDALMASVFVTIYIIIYSTQSPDIAFLSCLLQTLGIVNCFMLSVHMCANNSIGTAFNLIRINEHCLMFYMCSCEAHATLAVWYE